MTSNSLRRLGRWLLNALTVPSLLLCVAATGLWAADVVLLQRPGPPSQAAPVDHLGLIFRVDEEFAVDAALTAPGVLFYRVSPIFVALVGALPLARATTAANRMWRRRRRRDGHCPSCAYDLTGNVSGLCPECGTAVVSLKES